MTTDQLLKTIRPAGNLRARLREESDAIQALLDLVARQHEVLNLAEALLRRTAGTTQGYVGVCPGCTPESGKHHATCDLVAWLTMRETTEST